MMRLRSFEIVSFYCDKGISLPKRRSIFSAGYDIEAAADVVVPANSYILIPTGLKAYMESDEYLGLHIRSGLSIKKGLSLLNDEGVIDSDYYNNPGNEGHIMIAILNNTEKEVVIQKGDRIVQGIFKKYLLADDDNVTDERLGGLGSTG